MRLGFRVIISQRVRIYHNYGIRPPKRPSLLWNRGHSSIVVVYVDHLGKGSYNFYCVGTTWVFVYRCRVLGVREEFIYGF